MTHVNCDNDVMSRDLTLGHVCPAVPGITKNRIICSKICIKFATLEQNFVLLNPPTLSAKFRRTDVIPDFYSAGLKYAHINEIWPT